MTYRVDASKGGFLRGTLAPVDRSKEPRFSIWGIVEVMALILGVFLLMRYLLR